MVTLTVTKTPEELQQIIGLQQCNLPEHLSEEELQKEGFVTVRHDLNLLTRMHKKYPHAIAKDGDKVVGYALVMTKDFRNHIPVLIPMFAQIDGLVYKGRSLIDTPYFVMGQVCIEKAYRGKGIFRELYQTLKDHLSPYFTMVVTEVAKRNSRSLNAHYHVGFEILSEYTSENHEEWVIIGWSWEFKI